MALANPPHSSPRNQWVVSYTQSDVDTIREQIEQNEAAKRRWLFMALLIAVAALIGVVILVSSSYALYSKSESDKRRLSDENAALKTAGDQCQQQLKAATVTQEREAQTRTEAQSRLGTLLPAKLFRNWRYKSDSAMEVYTLVGGFVDGKWVIHSNLVARK